MTSRPGRIIKELGTAGSRFAFELFLEVWWDQIVEGLRKWLSKYTPADLQKMIPKGKFPSIPAKTFATLREYQRFIDHISVHRLMEAIAQARPDLAQAIEAAGIAGAEYMVKLRIHLLEHIRTPQKGMMADKPSKELVKAVCDECHKSWPVPKEEFANITECPFCGHSSQ